MNIRSMTGYAQVKTHVNDQLTLTVSLKSVNHRFLDLHLRIPSELDQVEMKVRRLLKERLHRGHIEVTLSAERTGGADFAVNRELVGGYLNAFRQAAEEFGVSAEPDLNAVLKLPGALSAAGSGDAADRLQQASIADMLFVSAGDSIQLWCESALGAGSYVFNAGITATLISSTSDAPKRAGRSHARPTSAKKPK